MSKAKTRILIADDDPLVRMIMVDTLENAGFDILEAANGAEACRLTSAVDRTRQIVGR